jgi:hypothetical protein
MLRGYASRILESSSLPSDLAAMMHNMLKQFVQLAYNVM